MAIAKPKLFSYKPVIAIGWIPSDEVNFVLASCSAIRCCIVGDLQILELYIFWMCFRITDQADAFFQFHVMLTRLETIKTACRAISTHRAR